MSSQESGKNRGHDGNDALRNATKKLKLNPEYVYLLHNTLKEHPQDLEMITDAYHKYPDAIQNRDQNNNLPLHVALISKSSLEVIKFLLEKYPRAAHMEDARGRLPEKAALYAGSPAGVLQHLVEEVSKERRTPQILHSAISIGVTIDILEEVFQACPESIRALNQYDQVPFFEAVDEEAPVEYFQFLFEKDAENATNWKYKDWTPVQYAVSKQAELDVVKLILEHLPDSIHQLYHHNRTLLHTAVKHNAPTDVLQWIIRLTPEAIHQTDDFGNLPHHLAAKHDDRFTTIHLLLKHGGNYSTTQNHDGQVPAEIAIRKGSPSRVVQLWLGDNFDRSQIGPLQWALQSPKTSTCTLSLLLFLFVKSDGNDIQFPEGKNPLLVAMSHNDSYDSTEYPVSVKDIALWASKFPQFLNDELIDPANKPTNWKIEGTKTHTYCLRSTYWKRGIHVHKNTLDVHCGNITGEKYTLDLFTDSVLFIGPVNCTILRRLVNETNRNRKLVYLSLPNQNIGDEGAQLIAELAKKCRVLSDLNIQNCGVGTAGLSSLLESVPMSRLKHIDLSNNHDIFNEVGGEMIGRQIALARYRCSFTLMSDADPFEKNHADFMEKLMSYCRLNYALHSFNAAYTWERNGLSLLMQEAIRFYDSSTHIRILRMKVEERDKAWPWVLAKIQSKLDGVDPLFCYIKDYLT